MPAKAMTSPPSPSIGRTKRRAARRARRAFGGPSSKSPSATLPSASLSIRQRVGPARLVTPARDRKPDRARCRCCRDHTMRPCRRYARSSRPKLGKRSMPSAPAWRGSCRRAYGCLVCAAAAISVTPRPISSMSSPHSLSTSSDWMPGGAVFRRPKLASPALLRGWPAPADRLGGIRQQCQYCGQLGKQDNCQVAVTLSLANDLASLPVAFDLYLPEEWAKDPVRRATTGVPKTLAFRTKPQIALEQIRHALSEGLPPGVVLGDAAYGIETNFRTALTAVSLSYVLGVQSTLGVWPPGRGPLPPKPWSGKG